MKRIRLFSLIAAGLWLGLASLPASADSDTLRVVSVLGIGNVSAGRRAPFSADPVAFQLATGSWKTPVEGDEVEVARIEAAEWAESVTDSENSDARREIWKRYRADDEGWIQSDSLAGGYALAVVECPRAGIYLLDGVGYRHVYVNGTPRIGDVYHRGFLRIPVALNEGPNELLFKEGWGSIRAEFYAPPSPVFFEDRDRTLPSVIIGSPDARAYAGIVVTNASEEWRRDLMVVARTPDGHEIETPVGSLPPARTRKVTVAFPYPRFGQDEAPDSVFIELELRADEDPGPDSDPAAGRSTVLDRTEFGLDVCAPNEKHYRSFVSSIDGSVQHYGVTPPPDPVPADSTVGLVLTFHGAGVPARQAHHYAQRDWTYIVAPTNRREFGFDWEDWGRLDALEVLEEADRVFALDPRRRWLTGHSMGGHGTWNFGAHFPDLFGAIGPSAGWRDFWSYTGAFELEGTEGVDEIMSRSSNASRTLLLERNYLHGGVFVLHGESDTNVPVEQARFMRERLSKFHPNFAYYERPGAGHWWGDECMDWPPLMEFLRRNPLPAIEDVPRLEFTTVHPAISSRCFWVSIGAQERWMAPSRVSATVSSISDSMFIDAETENVAQFSLDLGPFVAGPGHGDDADDGDADVDAGKDDGEEGHADEDDNDGAETTKPPGTLEIRVDADTLSLDAGRFLSSRVVHLEKDGPHWRPGRDIERSNKGPHRAGPFKEAFQHRMVFIIGTHGSPEETRGNLEKALFDAETFYYRGNGAVEVVLDVDFDAAEAPDRSVVLYGNADTNSAWNRVLSGCPIEVRRNRVQIGDQTVGGEDLGCLFVYPRTGSEVASVAAISGTGRVGSRALWTLPYFVSGVAYPDWILFGVDVLERGPGGVRAAGYFDSRWQLATDRASR